jgi:toxin ParE1/3/4
MGGDPQRGARQGRQPQAKALMTKVRQSAAARNDLVEHFVYLAENGGVEIADRFFENAAASFDVLAAQPMIGAPLTLQNPVLAGVRKWRVNGFDNYLIFYLPRADDVLVMRVLHGARDWRALLGLEP